MVQLLFDSGSHFTHFRILKVVGLLGANDNTASIRKIDNLVCTGYFLW